MKEKVIGILGGMGPEASCEIFRRIIKNTQAKTDADHIRVIMDSNTKIPDRTRAILNGGISPVDEMIKTAKNLQNAGADFIIIPCMTAHFFIDIVQKAIDIPIINALSETNKYINEGYPTLTEIGLLATSGTIATGLFQNFLINKKVITPEEKIQENLVMNTIYGVNGIKAGNTSPEIIETLAGVVDELKEKGAKGIISGCTEISLVMNPKLIDIPLIDPLTVLARRAIEIARA